MYHNVQKLPCYLTVDTLSVSYAASEAYVMCMRCFRYLINALVAVITVGYVNILYIIMAYTDSNYSSVLLVHHNCTILIMWSQSHNLS